MNKVGSLPAIDSTLETFKVTYSRLRPPRANAWTNRIRDGKRQCTACGQWIQLMDFYVHITKKTNRKNYDSRCNDCRKLEMVARRLKISVEEYRSRVIAANGVCAICGDAFKRASVDHCHKTGRVRGVLCGPCNNGLGHFKDSAVRLRAAADYLDRS